MAEREISIGRDSAADIVLSDPTVSRRHARATLTAGGDVVLSDVGSSNGLFIERNGKREKIERATLQGGDVVVFGSATLPAREILAALRSGETRRVEPAAVAAAEALRPEPGEPARRRRGRPRRDPKNNNLMRGD